MQLNKFTDEHQDIIDDIYLKWSKKYFCFKDINTKELKKSIDWLYNGCGLESPKLIVCKSINEAKEVFDKIQKGTSGVDLEAFNLIYPKDRYFEPNILANFDNYVSEKIRSVYNELKNKISFSTSFDFASYSLYKIKDKTKDIKFVYNAIKKSSEFWNENICSYGDFSTVDLAIFYEFFKKMKLCKSEFYENYIKLLNSNAFTMIQTKKVCIVVCSPQSIALKHSGRYGEPKGVIVTFKDNTGMYFDL